MGRDEWVDRDEWVLIDRIKGDISVKKKLPFEAAFFVFSKLDLLIIS